MPMPMSRVAATTRVSSSGSIVVSGDELRIVCHPTVLTELKRCVCQVSNLRSDFDYVIARTFSVRMVGSLQLRLRRLSNTQ